MTSTPAPPEPIRYDGDETGVLLLHGFSGSLEHLRPLAERLAGAGRTVLGVWLAGHGTSEEDLAAKRYDDWVLSLRRGVETLRRSVERIVIVGDSFGGNLGLHAALLGDPIAGVVTLGTPVSFRHDLINRALLPLVTRLRPYHRKSWVRDEAAQRASGAYVHVPLQAFAEVLRFIDRHTKRELEGVRVPVLVIQSRRDYEVHPSSAYFLYEHVGSDRKELIWIDERVHHVLLSKEADRLMDRISSFVNGTTQIA